jgi:hypothetical protein
MADQFQSIFNENFVRTPDGRYFLPFSKTHLGQQQMQQDVDESGTPFGEKYYRSGYDPESGFQRYSSLKDYFNATDPGSAGVVGPGAQNGLGINTQGMSAEQIAGLRGNYNGELGYYVDPKRIVGTHPATTAGMKPNEGGLWQMLSLLLPAVGELTGVAATAGEGASAASSSDAAAGTGAFGGSVPVAAGESGAGVGAAGSTVSGSEGGSTATGSAGNDTFGTGVDASGNPTGQYASGTGSSLNLGNSSLWGPVLGAGIGAAANISSANKAAKLQTEAGKEANATQLAMFDQARTDLQPWRTAGEGALGQLTQGIQPGGNLVRPFTMADFQNDPVTQASFSTAWIRARRASIACSAREACPNPGRP